MAKIDSTIATIAVGLVAAAAVGAMLTFQPGAQPPGSSAASKPAETQAATAAASRPQTKWATSATGRIEPDGGEVRIGAAVGGKVAAVLTAAGDRAIRGDLLVRLDDADHVARIAAAEAEAEVRRRERDEESKASGLALDRGKASDAAEQAERALHRARQAFDAALAAAGRSAQPAPEIINLRQAVIDKEKSRDSARQELARVAAQEGMPLPDRLESALTQSRSDLRLAYEALERTRIRAPFDGTVLRLNAKLGELAGPTAEMPLLTFGNLGVIKVRAEVEERDIAKVRLGQRVVVRADAFPDKDFAGQVTAVAPALGSPAIVSRGPRRPNDVDVLEVVATLEEASELIPGMRVDVFFTHPETAKAAAN